MNHMSSDIMMDVVNPPVVAIKSGQSSPQVTPFLHKQNIILQEIQQKSHNEKIFLESRRPCLHRNK